MPASTKQRSLDFVADARVPFYLVSAEDAERLRVASEMMHDPFERSSPADQVVIAELVAMLLHFGAPELAHRIRTAMTDVPIFRLKGLPKGEKGGRLRATALSVLRGAVFGYVEQHDGELTGAIEPKPDGADNSNASPKPFPFHTDDAVMPEDFRVEEIALLAIHNPAGTLTGFAILEDIL